MNQELKESESPDLQGAWIVVLGGGIEFDRFAVTIDGDSSKYPAIKPGDWLLATDAAAKAIGVGRIYRVRSRVDATHFHLDKASILGDAVPLADADVNLPSNSRIGRLQWTKFAEACDFTSRKVTKVIFTKFCCLGPQQPFPVLMSTSRQN